jgi:2-polyprenyl-6-methoxyphenol hydroxylase-like FAD-dependent oxidoreductase
MLGLLLARAGVDVAVLEKHGDFLRDFRGDTIHPSTLELMHELGILNDFLRQPHVRLNEVTAHFGPELMHIGDFTHLPTRCKFIAIMPQWDFLNFISSEAKKLPGFRLLMETEATDLIIDNDCVKGVRAKTKDGGVEVRADLVAGADGRSSTVRTRAGLGVVDRGSPIDVLWFRVSRRTEDPPESFGFVNTKQFMVLIDRGDYWQCAFIIPKDSFPEKQKQGIEAFREEIKRCVPFLGGRVNEIKDWDGVKLLTVKVDYLRHWHREGLLCIGDSAHAMSPVGGVGINLAIQDAVAAANLLAVKLREGCVKQSDLQAVQNRRERPARMTQTVQIFLHEHLLKPIFESDEMITPPVVMRLFERFPRLRRLPARMVGMGFRPEHIGPDLKPVKAAKT